MKKLTDATVKGLPKPAKGNRLYFDQGKGSVPGFAVRVTAAGARSYVLDYLVRDSGRQRRMTIGRTDDWRATAARQEARELRARIDAGADPMGDIHESRAAPTMGELVDRFVAEHLPKRRPSTRRAYQGMLDRYVRPHFGAGTKVRDVRHNDIEELHRKITELGHSYAGNRCVAMLSKMFSLAKLWEMRDDNPCEGIERNKEFERRRYLRKDDEVDELAALLTALAAYPEKQTANVIRLLILTGARRGEVLGMRWNDINLSAGTWSKPPSSTKQREHHQVPLSGPARLLLSEIRGDRRKLPEFVFPGAGKRGHIVEIKKGWRSICRSAGIKGLRMHDLRHSFASEVVSGGGSLELIGALLGHSQASTTKRYSHLYDTAQRVAVEKLGAKVDALTNGTPSAEVIPLKQSNRPRVG